MNKKISLYILIFALVLFLTACKPPASVDPDFTIKTVSENIGSTPQDVFFIFTNSSTTDTTTVAPSVSSSIRSLENWLTPERADNYSEVGKTLETGIIREIREYESEPISLGNSISRSAGGPSYSYTEFPDDDPGSSPKDFKISLDGATTIKSTNRYYVTSNNGTKDITLSIWVADDAFTGGTKTNLVTQQMVNDMAMEFLIAGADNDIYDWVTGIYGEPWGAQPYPNLLPVAASDNITILLYDIDGDNSSYGGAVGYYYSKDNYIYSVEDDPGSNERIMFYIDSVIYANGDDDGNPNTNPGSDSAWIKDDFWPQTMFSTLAHEFQHMIHFYQKQILNGLNSSTDIWVNEMCSEVTEDLIADKQGVTGPRGLNNGGTAGSAAVSSGRLPLFNDWTENSFLIWDYNDGNLVLRDYSSVYAFGAFLARNYGGAPLFEAIVQSSYVDENAVVNALNILNGTNKTFKDLLIEWGKAVLNSEDDTYSPGYNSGGYYSSSLGGITYNLGSIDLNNYSSGPFIFDNRYVIPTLGPGTNLYYNAGTDLTGTQSWTVEVPTGVTLTVVTKVSS